MRCESPVPRRRDSAQPPRLLVAIPGEQYGGAERYSVRIAEAARAEFDVAAAVRPLDATRALRSDLASSGVRTFELPAGRRLRGVLGFAALIALHRPDVVHVSLPWPTAARGLRAAVALTGVPTVLVHQVVPPAAELEVDRPRFYAWTRSRRQTWVAVSDYGRRELAAAFGLADPGAIELVYNAPRENGNGSAPAPVADGRLALGLEPGDQVVVSVGRLSHEKGHDLLIGAAAQLRGRFPRLRVLIAGSGYLRDELERAVCAAKLEQHVRLVGQVQDVGSLLSVADAFVLPSRREGTPFALLEAMSRGLPVIAARFGGADEIVDSGENGLLVPMDDAVELAAALAATLEDTKLAMRLGERARERRDRFSEPVMLGQTLALLATAGGREASI
jgi:glycosyltransferase involved in cell wall biosynthesis